MTNNGSNRGIRLRRRLIQCTPISECYPTRYFDFSLKVALITSTVKIERSIDTKVVMSTPMGSIWVFNQNFDKYSLLNLT